MVSYDYIMVRFGELSTKGKNKKDFIRTLYLNIKHFLKDFNVEVESRYDHIYVHLKGNEYEPIIERLQDISGIQGLNPNRLKNQFLLEKKLALNLSCMQLIELMTKSNLLKKLAKCALRFLESF